MKKEEQELLFFVIGEREENFIYPMLSNHFKRRIFQIMFIYDMKGVSLYKTYTKLLPVVKMGSHVFSNFFPGTMHKLIIVNAGTKLGMRARLTKRTRFQRDLGAGQILVEQGDAGANFNRNRVREKEAFEVCFG